MNYKLEFSVVLGILEEREKRWLFFCEHRYFFLTAEERINTDEPYPCVC